MSDQKNPFIMPRRRSRCWIFALPLLAACTSEPVKNNAQWEDSERSRAPVTPSNPAPKSYGLSDDQSSRHLLNADTFIQAGDTEAAQKELDLVNLGNMGPEQRSRFNLLAAQIALSSGDAEQALKQLKLVRPVLLARQDKINFYQSLAFGHMLTGEVLPAVSARFKMGDLLDQPEQQQANVVAILDMLSVLPEEHLQAHPEMAGELRGWTELAKILKQRGLANIDGPLQQWRQNFPGHPANADFLQAYLNKPQTAPEISAEGVSSPPAAGMVAVFLPVSGPYAPAGKAIQIGLEAAYRLAASVEPRLPLKFYDSGKDDIAALYSQAIADGAKQVIGPLVKEQIQALAQSAELSVPVLALNHVENLHKNNLYQFGLSPIDEAEALAHKARGDGRQSALVLVPNTAHGQRIGQYLATSWQQQGGVLAGLQTYDPGRHDIGAVLNQLTASLTYPGAPQGPRALLLSANDDVARELAPQLKYQTGELAVYAMPNIYSGQPNPVQDAELGAFGFCDMPWLFGQFYQGPLSQEGLQNSWQAMPAALTRLIPLGIDAYNVLPQLPQLAKMPFAGASGQLSLNAENRITRKLVCAQFTGGVPVATGYSD